MFEVCVLFILYNRVIYVAVVVRNLPSSASWQDLKVYRYYYYN